ncbi:hypothetical protein [Aeromicrobium sp. P5_D10]
MTSLVSSLASRLPRALRPARLVPLAAGVLVVVGIVAAATDHYGLAIAMILLLQTAMIGLIAEQRLAIARSEASLKQAVDQASSRTLADLSRVRHAILSGLDESRQHPSR